MDSETACFRLDLHPSCFLLIFPPNSLAASSKAKLFLTETNEVGTWLSGAGARGELRQLVCSSGVDRTGRKVDPAEAGSDPGVCVCACVCARKEFRGGQPVPGLQLLQPREGPGAGQRAPGVPECLPSIVL